MNVFRFNVGSTIKSFFLCVSADDRRLAVLMDLFDSNKDGTINYNEFLFMFVDRRAIIKQWEDSCSLSSTTGSGQDALVAGIKGVIRIAVSLSGIGGELVLFLCAGTGVGGLQRELHAARLKAALLSASATPGSGKGDGMIARSAAENVLLRQRIFPNKVCLFRVS